MIFFLSLSFILLSQQRSYGQKNDKEKTKKINVLPVYLTYSGLPFDTAIQNSVKEAFARRKVKLINKEEFDKASNDEANRIIAKFRLRSSEFSSERELREAASKEQKYVVNLLKIQFYIQRNEDTVNVIGARWEATPYPTNMYGSELSSGKIDTELTDICCSARDNIFAIIDKILYSKWLQ